MEIKDTQTNEGAGSTAQQVPEEKQEPQTKRFTQEDVNKIVENRLAKERKRLAALFNDPQENELSKKEKELLKRETKADMREYFLDNNVDLDLLQFVDLNNGKEAALKSYENFKKAFDLAVSKRVEELIKGGKPISKVPNQTSNDLKDEQIRKAFKL